MVADRIIAWSLACALAFFPALSAPRQAQALTAIEQAAILSYQPPAAAVVTGFVGSNDAVSGAKEIWSDRCADAALATGTTKIFNITRASDSTSTDVVCLTSGAGDVATASAFCASTTCKIGTFYGQLGFMNLVEGTSAARPVLTFSAVGTRMCATFSSGTVLPGSSVTQAQPFTMTAVVVRTSGTAAQTIFESATNDTGLNFSTANLVGITANSGSTQLVASETDGAPHAVVGAYNGASSLVVVDGAAPVTSPSPGTSGLSGVLRMGTGFADLLGIVCEMRLDYVALNSTQAATLVSNMRGFYGF